MENLNPSHNFESALKKCDYNPAKTIETFEWVLRWQNLIGYLQEQLAKSDLNNFNLESRQNKSRGK